MTSTKYISSILLVSFFLTAGCSKKSTTHGLTQFEFSDSLSKFAPELAIKNNTYKGSFSEDYMTFYFLRRDSIKNEMYIPYKSIFKNGKWSNPIVMDYYDPKFSYTYQITIPKENKLLLLSNIKNSLSKEHDSLYHYSFWIKDMNQSKAALVELGPENILDKYNSQPSITKNGKVYFTSSIRGVPRKTFYHFVYNKEGNLVAIPFDAINEFNEKRGVWIGNLSMHPEEKCMIIAMRVNENGVWKELDFYISYNKNGQWTNPLKIKTKGINTEGIEAFPYITHDGKYFMFTRNRSEFYIIPMKNIHEDMSKILTPKLFLKKILSNKVESSLTFSPDRKELFFVRKDSFYTSGKSTIYTSKFENGAWSKPIVASFSGKYSDTGCFISPDGKKLFFTSNRPIIQNKQPKKNKDIWVIEKIGNTWGIPKHLKINSEKSEYSPTTDAQGNLYFGSYRDGGKGSGDIWVSYYKNGNYKTPVNLGVAINSDGGEWGSCISPKGDFIIFEASGRADNITHDGDLYISHYKDGVWTKSKHLGNLNSGGSDLSPKIHGDSLYFASNRHKDRKIEMNNNNVDLYSIPLKKILSNK